MRAFILLLIGLLIGAGAGIVASHIPPTQELIAREVLPYLPKADTQGLPLPLTQADLDPETGSFPVESLAALGITPCFPGAEALKPRDKPWLIRDTAAEAPDGTVLAPFPDLADYPGLIKIEGIRSELGSQREHCAAVRVAEHWFLTAAHCLADLGFGSDRPTYDVIAVTPAQNVRTDAIAVQSITGAVCHAAYSMNRQQYPNDVALFYLDDVSAFEAVDIARMEQQADGLFPRDLDRIYIAGWGRNGGTFFLQGGPVALAEAGESVLVADKIGPRGPNVGDSGAPLYAARPDGPLVVGVLSQVTQDRDQNGDRSIYVRVKAVEAWAQTAMAICAQDQRFLCSPALKDLPEIEAED